MTRTSLSATSVDVAAPLPRTASLPQRVGRWELVALVAEGTLGRVYRARAADASDSGPAPYAVKLLADRWESDPRALEQFFREAQVGRTVADPHVVPVLAAGLRRPPYYLVMPWLEGQTLRRRLAAGVSVPVPEALWIARQTAEGLDGLGRAGWQHGDIQPGNIHVSPQGHVTLLDLGFARRAGQPDPIHRRVVAGTPAYLAPERLTSALAGDVRSDLYSLGAVLYEMLSGRRPFEADSIAALADAHRRARPTPLERLAPHVPGEVASLVGELLAKEPLRRPQTPAELVERLARLEIALFDHRA